MKSVAEGCSPRDRMKARPTMADSCEESSGRSPFGMRGMVVSFLRVL